MRRYLQIIEDDKFLILLPFLAIITRLIIYLFIPHTYEDAFITFRYAENLAEGLGLVYNEGERVYGTTTPLFAIIMAAFKSIGVPCVLSSLTINLLAEGITSLIVYKFLKDYSDGRIAACVTLLFVFSPSNISWSIQGMETSFFGCIIALSFFYLYKKKYFLAFLCGFFSSMIRIDALSVLLIVFLFTFINQKFDTFRLLLLPLSIFITWLIFLQMYFGNFLPNSMLAKLILYSGHQTSILPNLEVIFEKFFKAGIYSSSILTLLFILGILIVFLKNKNLSPMVIWFLLYYFALVLSKTNIHGWYLIPPLYVYISISGIAIIFLFDKFQKKFNLSHNLIQTILFITIIFFSIIMLYIKINQISTQYNYEQNVRIKIGKFLRDNTHHNSTVFLEPIGIIGYFSERYIFDDAALISPIFLEYNKLPYNAESRYKKIQLVKPDYLVLREKYLEEFYAITSLINDYTLIKSFKDINNNKDIIVESMSVFERKKMDIIGN